MTQRYLRVLCITLSTLFAGAPAHPTYAGMIGTEHVLSKHQIANDRSRIQTALEREDVKQAFLQHGVNPEQVQKRLDQLTDEEIHQLANKFDQLPAASGAGEILLVTGLVVVILELLGITDIFTGF